MPEVEIHADYDRDGRLARRTAEYNLRNTSPGAIVLANLDIDNRSLPSPGMALSGTVILDKDRSSKTRRENDLTTVVLRASQAALASACTWSLVVRGEMAARIKVVDASGRVLQPEISPLTALEYRIQINRRINRFQLEATTLPGTPVLRRATLVRNVRSLVVHPLVEVELRCRDATGQITTVDQGQFSIAPIVFLSNTERVRHIYIASDDENYPSVRDFERSLREANLSQNLLVKVSNQSDKWMQDQFQVGYVESPSGWMHVIFHLPRLRANAIQTTSQPNNLANFVSAHFPSRDLGVFEDFWHRTFPIRTADAGFQSLRFRDSGILHFEVIRASSVGDRLLIEIRKNGSDADRRFVDQKEEQFEDFFAFIRLLPVIRSRFRRVINRVIGDEDTSDQLKEQLRDLKADLERQTTEVLRKFRIPRPGVIDVLLFGTQRATVTRDELTRILDRLDQVHDSTNYGGNLEVVPPTPNAPLGTLMIGNVTFSDQSTTMDPDLISFLTQQGEQLLMEIDTRWLHVGHVDEILTTVPNRTRSGTFAFLMTSPKLGKSILQKALDLNVQGVIDADLPGGSLHPQTDPFPPEYANRNTWKGNAPLTRLLRGKYWSHIFQQSSDIELLPPALYQNLSRFYARRASGLARNFPLRFGTGPDRFYRADITVPEVLFFERDQQGNSTNERLEANFIEPLRELLEARFEGKPVIKLPVIFDAVNDVEKLGPESVSEKTVAFTPNMVNMQILGNHLIIPRPYGPRMKIRDAASVIDDVLEAEGLSQLKGTLTSQFVRSSRRRLNRTEYWVLKDAKTANINQIAKRFRDGFPQFEDNEIEEIEERIYRRNSGSFLSSGQLKDGWHLLTIPENTIDLFEAYTEVVLSQLRVDVHWVDSWFYHVLSGEIHCGTNVIRQPDQNRTPWWEAQFSRSITIEEAEAITTE